VWHRWIMLAHVSGDSVIRRKEVGRTSDGVRQTRAIMVIAPFRYCEDCTPEYQGRMAAVSRCEWVKHHTALDLPPPLKGD
jgi:hypothetical protein